MGRQAAARLILGVALGAALVMPTDVGTSAATTQGATASNGWVAYGAQQSGRSGWVLMHADGTDQHFVALPDWARGAPRGMRWSPDGTELAMSLAVEEGGVVSNGWLVLTETDGSGPAWLATSPEITTGIVDQEPVWTPAATELVFNRVVGPDSVIAATNMFDDVVGLTDGEDWSPDVSPDRDVAFTHKDGPVHQSVWIRPSNGASPYQVISSYSSSPEFSPDGSRLAYLELNTTTVEEDLYTSTSAGTDPVLIAPDVEIASWSPDGTQLLYVTRHTGAPQVCVVAFSGGTAACVDAPTLSGGSLAWQPVPAEPEPVVRLAGSNRIATAVAVSQAGFPADSSAAAAVLARSDTFPDALAGTPLAVEKGGPLLLTPPSALAPAVLGELERALGPGGGKTVYLLGDTGALSAAVDSAVRAAGFTTVRLAGANRYATAVAIAQALPSPDQVFLATGTNFPDALAAGAAAGSYWGGPEPGGGVVLLTRDEVLPTQVASYLAAHSSATVTTVGGQAAAAYPASDIELAGVNRYETAEFVALVHFGAAVGVGVATGTNFPDALAGGALLASHNLPLLLATSASLPVASSEYIEVFSGSVGSAFVFGGSDVVPDLVAAAVGDAMALSWTQTSTPAGPVSLPRSASGVPTTPKTPHPLESLHLR